MKQPRRKKQTQHQDKNERKYTTSVEEESSHSTIVLAALLCFRSAKNADLKNEEHRTPDNLFLFLLHGAPVTHVADGVKKDLALHPNGFLARVKCDKYVALFLLCHDEWYTNCAKRNEEAGDRDKEQKTKVHHSATERNLLF